MGIKSGMGMHYFRNYTMYVSSHIFESKLVDDRWVFDKKSAYSNRTRSSTFHFGVQSKPYANERQRREFADS